MKMRFFCLHEGIYEGVQIRLDQLREACKKLDIEFIGIDSTRIDFTDLPSLKKGDLLYNAARGSEKLESLLINDQVTTFYKYNPGIIVHNSDTTKYSIIHEKEGLTAPKTIFSITTDRQKLKKYVDYLGGFPIIIKASGSTRGIGTIKIETWENLISTADFLIGCKESFILREFINAKSGCRMITLGDEVVSAAEFFMIKDDFRNAVDLDQVRYKFKEYPVQLQETAVKATHSLNLQFAGVDFLEDNNGNFFLLEVNFPTGFSSLKVGNVDIPLKMISFLRKKALSNV